MMRTKTDTPVVSIKSALGGLYLCAALFGLATVSVVATANQTHRDIAEATTPYPRAEVVLSEEREVVDYAIALGPVKKDQGVWQPEKEHRVAGELTRRTMQIPEGHASREAYQFYRKRLQALQARPLFLCEGRDCGASNSWANNVFEVKELYGSDGDQYYGVFEVVDTDRHLNYIVVYTVARGNQRVYAHVELLKTTNVPSAAVASEPQVILQALQRNNFHVVSGVTRQGDKLQFKTDHLDAVVKALQRERGLMVHVAGHDYSDNSLKTQMHQSLDYARQYAERLVEEGIPAKRLETHGVGSLAPMRESMGSDASLNESSDFRLELVVTEDLLTI